MTSSGKNRNISPVVEALLATDHMGGRSALLEAARKSSQRALDRFTAEKAAEKVIYSHVSNWAGTKLEPGGHIPILQDTGGFGSLFKNELTGTILTGISEVRAILEGSITPSTSDLSTKLKELENLKESLEAAGKALAEADPMYLAKAALAVNVPRNDTEVRIVMALRPEVSAILGVEILSQGLVEEIGKTRETLESFGKVGRGKPKDEAAYRVALEAARLFAMVLGERPTYSENVDGLSGKFTPFLRDLFDAFGWKNRTLRGPAEQAIGSLTESDFQPPSYSRVGGLFSLANN